MQSKVFLSNHPIRSLVFSFLAWKSLLLLIAVASPGPGYDTSTSLLKPSRRHLENSVGELPAPLRHFVEKLTRWDAIYFVKAATRGYLFEQEWAFGWGFTRIIACCTDGIGKLGVPHYEGLEALVGIIIAHVAHLLSVLVLFGLGIQIYPSSHPGFAFTAAFLHIIAPAGLFLSAPYAESSCALLTFSGVLLFAKSYPSSGETHSRHDLLILLSGISFGIATTFRSNGIFNGLLLLEEAFRTLFSLAHGFGGAKVRRLMVTGVGGLSVGAGFLLPQYIAWKEYCGQSDADVTSLRPWCQESLPSIYSFVQDHYWNVGLFRYWTLSNLPLFLLATPMITLMVISSLWAWKCGTGWGRRATKLQDKGKKLFSQEAEPSRVSILRNLAVSQLLLALLTLTTAHVQIITRISSAYPLCFWYLADQVGERSSSPQLRGFVRFMVIYGIVQGGLFASFLPPA